MKNFKIKYTLSTEWNKPVNGKKTIFEEEFEALEYKKQDSNIVFFNSENIDIKDIDFDSIILIEDDVEVISMWHECDSCK